VKGLLHYVATKSILDFLRSDPEVLRFVGNQPTKISIVATEYAYGKELGPPVITLQFGAFTVSIDRGSQEGVYPYSYTLPWEYKGDWPNGEKKYGRSFIGTYQAPLVMLYWDYNQYTEQETGTKAFVNMVKQHLFRTQYWVIHHDEDIVMWGGKEYNFTEGYDILCTLNHLEETIVMETPLYRVRAEILVHAQTSWSYTRP
jgi:hypothetical protein